MKLAIKKKLPDTGSLWVFGEVFSELPDHLVALLVAYLRTLQFWALSDETYHLQLVEALGSPGVAWPWRFVQLKVHSGCTCSLYTFFSEEKYETHQMSWFHMVYHPFRTRTVPFCGSPFSDTPRLSVVMFLTFGSFWFITNLLNAVVREKSPDNLPMQTLLRLLWLLLPLCLLRWNRRRAGLWRGLGPRCLNGISNSLVILQDSPILCGSLLENLTQPPRFQPLAVPSVVSFGHVALRFQTHGCWKAQLFPRVGGCSSHPLNHLGGCKSSQRTGWGLSNRRHPHWGWCIWRFAGMGVPWGTPKSSSWIGVSTITIHLRVPHLMENLHMASNGIGFTTSRHRRPIHTTRELFQLCLWLFVSFQWRTGSRWSKLFGTNWATWIWVLRWIKP